jgi:hypothetical protein
MTRVELHALVSHVHGMYTQSKIMHTAQSSDLSVYMHEREQMHAHTHTNTHNILRTNLPL